MPETQPGILLIECHPDPQSLCKSLANALVDGLGERKVSLVRHDLAAEGFTAELTAADIARRSSMDPQVLAMERELRSCSHLVLVFPLWWGTMPALLTAWVQRVFSLDTAYTIDEPEPGFTRVRGLQTNLDIHLILAADQPEPPQSGLRLIWEEDICAFTGAKIASWVWCGPVRTSSASQRRTWLQKAGALGASLHLQ